MIHKLYILFFIFFIGGCSIEPDTTSDDINSIKPAEGVIVQEGDNLNDDGYIKPELDSPTTKQFIENIQYANLQIRTEDYSIQEMKVETDGSFTANGMRFVLKVLKNPTTVVYYTTSTDLKNKTSLEGYFSFEVENNTYLNLFKVINEYETEKPDDSITDPSIWTQFYQKKFAFNNIDWDNKEVVAFKKPTPEQINSYVNLVRSKNFVNSVLGSPLTISDNGDFISNNKEYKLLAILDDKTAKYSCGNTIGIKEKTFGIITDNLISTVIGIQQSTPEQIASYVSMVRSKNFVNIVSGSPLTICDNGDFSFNGTEYKLLVISDNTSAEYLGGNIIGIKEEIFGIITDNSISTVIGIQQSTPEQIASYVSMVRSKNFVNIVSGSPLTICDNGDFSFNGTEYKLLVISDNTSAEYLGGNIIGIKEEIFGIIQDNEIVTPIGLSEMLVQVNEYVNTINNKNLTTINNGSVFELSPNGTFSFQGTTYILDNVINNNSATYTRNVNTKLSSNDNNTLISKGINYILAKIKGENSAPNTRNINSESSVTYALKEEFFGRVENGIIVEKVASTYDYRLIELIEDVNSSSLVTLTGTPFTIGDTGDFNYNGTTYTFHEINDLGFVYSDGKTYLFQNTQFGYLDNGVFKVIALFVNETQQEFINNINNKQFMFATMERLDLPFSGEFTYNGTIYQLQTVIDASSAVYTDGVETLIVGYIEDCPIFGELPSGHSPSMSSIFALQQSSSSDIDRINQQLISKQLIGHDGNIFSLAYIEASHNIIAIRETSDSAKTVYLSKKTNPLYKFDYIRTDYNDNYVSLTINGNNNSSRTYQVAGPTTPENIKQNFIEKINGLHNMSLLITPKGLLFALNNEGGFIANNIHYKYFYQSGVDKAVYSYTINNLKYAREVEYLYDYNGTYTFGSRNYTPYASTRNKISKQYFIDQVNSTKLISKYNGEELIINSDNTIFLGNGRGYTFESIEEPGKIIAKFGSSTCFALKDNKFTKITLKHNGTSSEIVAIKLENNEQNQQAIETINNHNFISLQTGDPIILDQNGSFSFDNVTTYKIFQPIKDNEDTEFEFIAYNSSGTVIAPQKFYIVENSYGEISFRNSPDTSGIIARKLTEEDKSNFRNYVNNKQFLTATGDILRLTDNLHITNGPDIYKPLYLQGDFNVIGLTMMYLINSKEVQLSALETLFGEPEVVLETGKFYISTILGAKHPSVGSESFKNYINGLSMKDIKKQPISINYNGKIELPYSTSSSEKNEYIYIREHAGSRASYLKWDKVNDKFSMVRLVNASQEFDQLNNNPYTESEFTGSRWIGARDNNPQPLIDIINDNNFVSELQNGITLEPTGDFTLDGIQYTSIGNYLYTTNGMKSLLHIENRNEVDLQYLIQKETVEDITNLTPYKPHTNYTRIAIDRSSEINSFITELEHFYYSDGTSFDIKYDGTFVFEGERYKVISYDHHPLNPERRRMRYIRKSDNRTGSAYIQNNQFILSGFISASSTTVVAYRLRP